ncbi:DNA-binding response regulator, NarL/FixJ family, contains REC and HTH domains [Saccharopolyspora antimicrobica]|uniref:DNA-binding response regulator, NarL/FixJ family, contains REC and HTH domains n=1 Tax=Saccharopolyspora antimicrobica TaxID=455193 RepID=A0A1I5IMZ1_9PSEU|nr:response regulator transcription factor [Saccharopolyspora antimicrobica]RKT84060.1 LuxR family two component transcriptional regulator [Saccharopolyspora antimicrobica]SFO61822.1 DNA-binding response regulator, NarL/FixJ family, contains REC and HTH domains [Saccharopolyspora antimicrobica]
MIRVLLVDDESLVRAGLRMVLEPADDIEVVAEAANGSTAIEAAVEHRPDVVLMDVRMPGVDGLTALKELRRLPDPPSVIMLTTFDLDDYVHTALRDGAAGFLLKDTSPRELANAVRIIADGSAMLTPSVTKRLIDTFAGMATGNLTAARQRLSVLTGRESEVVRAVALGLSNAAIARDLAMSEGTVKAHVSRSLTKLGLTNRVQLALLVRDAGQ